MAKTGYVFDERFLMHDTGEHLMQLPRGGYLEGIEHPSNNRITRRAARLIAGSEIVEHLQQIPVREATLGEVHYCHTPDYVEHVRNLDATGGGMLDDQTRVTRGSFEAALLSAGGAIELTDAVLDGRAKNGYGLLRPIGHHAMADQGMGFCVFNNVVIATRHAQQQRGIERIAIIDWDVHHGNGTQSAHWDDTSVLFISLHQDNWYPAGWGSIDQTGGDGAKGHTVNIPLPPGTGNQGYEYAFERVVLPIVREFGPELIFISAGQDANMADPLGRMLLTMDGYRNLTEQLKTLAEEICGGRLIALQEGGYTPAYVPFCTLGIIEGLVGEETSVADPWAGSSEYDHAVSQFSDREKAAVEAARSAQEPFWSLG
ncbi:MAG: class II histone deacetylase [Sphaerobacteraceae bacterium]|nr:MAG: class II histone deacetylase [Sphaerobacteraceae bacterium]